MTSVRCVELARDQARSARCLAQDRSGIYGGFHRMAALSTNGRFSRKPTLGLDPMLAVRPPPRSAWPTWAISCADLG